MCEKRKDALAGSCAEIWAEKGIMTWNRCVLCGSTRATDSGASFHRFPADKTARARWIANLQLVSFPDPFCARARNLKLGGGERP